MLSSIVVVLVAGVALVVLTVVRFSFLNLNCELLSKGTTNYLRSRRIHVVEVG